MTRIFISVILIFICSVSYAQETSAFADFLKECEAETGVWYGDNAAYQSEQEPFDTYVLEWTWGINNKSLIGKLYGLTDGKASNTFWEFRKYWDGKNKEAVVLQFGGDGTVGIGPIKQVDKQNSELLQVFTRPDGVQYTTGHKTIILDAHSHIGASYSVDEEGKWTENRSYKWVKQEK